MTGPKLVLQFGQLVDYADRAHEIIIAQIQPARDQDRHGGGSRGQKTIAGILDGKARAIRYLPASPAALMTGAHCSKSSFWIAASWAGVVPVGVSQSECARA